MAIVPELGPNAGQPLESVIINGRVFQPRRFPSGLTVWGDFESFEEANRYPILKSLNLHALIDAANTQPDSLLPWKKYLHVFISENSGRLTRAGSKLVSPHDVVERMLRGEDLEEIQIGWFVNRMAGTQITVEDVETAGRRANRELSTVGLTSGYGKTGITVVPSSVFTAEGAPYTAFPEQREYEPNELENKPKRTLWERLLLRVMSTETQDPKKIMVKLIHRYDPKVFNTLIWLANGYLADRNQRLWVSERGIERGPLYQTQAAA